MTNMLKRRDDRHFGMQETQSELEHARPNPERKLGKAVGALGVVLCLLFVAGLANAQMDDTDRARRMHDRLAGVPPDDVTLGIMAGHIGNTRADLAADLAMQNPNFYNVVLKNFVTPWTNEAQTIFAPLNDYTATVIGMIRDDVPFNLILSEDMVYTGANGVVTPNFQQTSNAHYEALEDNGIDLSDPAMLIQRTQSGLPGSQMSTGETAGVITTRAAAEAFFTGGTNRAMWRFTAVNHLCQDMEQLKGHHPSGRSHSPGCDAQPWRRQRNFPQYLLWVSCGNGRHGRGLRLFRMGRSTGAHDSYARRRSGQAFDQRKRIPLRIHHDRQQLDQLLARRPELCAPTGVARVIADSVPRVWVQKSLRRVRSQSAKSRKFLSTFVFEARRIRTIATRLN